jgi:hypothetical protein
VRTSTLRTRWQKPQSSLRDTYIEDEEDAPASGGLRKRPGCGGRSRVSVERRLSEPALTKQLVASDSAASVTKGRIISDDLPQPARIFDPRAGASCASASAGALFDVLCLLHALQLHAL